MIKKQIPEDNHKLAITQLVKARKLQGARINPFKPLKHKLKESEKKKEPDENERRGMTQFDVISQKISNKMEGIV